MGNEVLLLHSETAVFDKTFIGIFLSYDLSIFFLVTLRFYFIDVLNLDRKIITFAPPWAKWAILGHFISKFNSGKKHINVFHLLYPLFLRGKKCYMDSSAADVHICISECLS